MNNKQKAILSILVLSLLAFSAYVSIANGALINSNTLTIAGSSTVYPIANEEAGVWQTYWNNLVTANPSWGANQCSQPVSLAGLGSGTAIPALYGGQADIGEMSRPPNTGAEWNDFANLQLWGVGIDSVAIVLSPDMTWFTAELATLEATSTPGLTTAEVASLFGNGTFSGTNTGGLPTTAFTTWNDFFNYWFPTTYTPVSQGSNTINRAVRDPTSGTFDCFNNYFAVPNGYSFEHKTSGTVDASQNMAPYTLDTENINIWTTMTATGANNYIGFISLGYLQVYGVILPINISYNIANVPSSTIAVTNPAVWSVYAQPTRDNVYYALTGTQAGSATARYFAWRYLWEVTPSTIPNSGPTLETGVWIAYMLEWNTTGTTIAGTPQSNFVNDQAYINLNRDDMAGAAVLNGDLSIHTVTGGQTTTIPDGKVNFLDTKYFVSAYIAYYSANTYNPYADMNADGHINFSDIKAFVATYIQYYQNFI